MSEVELYHKDVGFPRDVEWPQGSFPLYYTYHAKKEAREDPLGDVSRLLPPRLDLANCNVVEAQIERGIRVRLMVCRTPLTHTGLDLVMVVKTEKLPWRVLTVYLNESGDDHRSLDTSRYKRPKGE